MNTTSYLQLVCLVENVRTEFSDVRSLVEFYNGDIRRALLALQYWIKSGATGTPTLLPVRYLHDCLSTLSVHMVETELPAVVENSLAEVKNKQTAFDCHPTFIESGDEFECLKPQQRNRRQIISDDDDSCADTGKASPIKAVPDLLIVNDDSNSCGSRTMTEGCSNKNVTKIVTSDLVLPLHQLTTDVVDCHQSVQVCDISVT